MNDFHILMKKIGEELGIKVTLLSDDWTTLYTSSLPAS